MGGREICHFRPFLLQGLEISVYYTTFNYYTTKQILKMPIYNLIFSYNQKKIFHDLLNCLARKPTDPRFGCFV